MGGSAPPAIPTFRSLGALGANLSQTNSVYANRLYTNAFYNGARLTKTGQFGVNCARDATTGWPTEAFYVCLSQAQSNGTVLLDGALPPGTYNWSYSYATAQGLTTLTMASTGSNTPTCVGISGFTLGAPVVNGATTTRSFSFTIAAGGTATFSFDNGITFFDAPIDGQATVVGQPLHRDEALAYYSQFGVIRLLDFLQTNGRFDMTWGQRPPNYTGPQLAGDVTSWERAWAFMQAVLAYPGSKVKTWMLNIPPYANDDYSTQLATLFTTLGVPANLLEIEYANEPWNSASSIRFNGFQWAAMNSAQGIANYQLSSTYNASQPSALYQGPGVQITGMSIDTAGLCTVTLAANCSTYLDYSTGLPFIVNGATVLVACATNLYNKNSAAPVNTATVTVSNVSGNTFQYSTGVAGAGGSFTGSTPNTSIFFNTASNFLADNLSFTIANMRVKWSVYRTYQAQAAWRAVRPKATYGEKFYLNLQPFGDLTPAPNRLPPTEFPYANFLGGSATTNGAMASWLDAIAVATYAVPSGTVAAYADLFDSSKSTSLYSALNGTGVVASVDHRARTQVYQCLINRVQPTSYEGGIALQTASSSAFGVQAFTDPLTETYLTAHMDVVLKNGVTRYMNFSNSPRVAVNGSSGNSLWQSVQYFSDSIVSTDANYSARRAAQDKYATQVSYSNINGSDLTTLDISTYQNATELTGSGQSNGINATNGALYWNSATGLGRNVDWVYPVNSLAARQVFVDGTDAQATPVKLYAYPPDLGAPIFLGTVHLPVNGITNSSTGSTIGPCPDPVTWTPPRAGPWVIRVMLDAGTGTGPGIRRVRFV